MSKPRLLMVATVVGPIRTFLLPFAEHFRAQGWQVDAMANRATTCPKCARAFDRVWEVELSRCPAQPWNLVRALAQVRRVHVAQRYDLVHVHTPIAAFVARLALSSFRPGVKVIYTAHGFHFHPAGPRLRNLGFLALEKLAGRWTDYLVTINHEDERAAKRYRLVPPERVWYMPGIGVDTVLYSPDAVQDTQYVRDELGLQPGDGLFLMIGQLLPRKRPQDAVLALAQLDRPNAHLALAGGGPLQEQVGELARRLGLQGRVHLLGFRHDVPALTRASVATILPSEQEGLPRSILESLSLEVPVIATAIRGVQELLSDGCGLLASLGDVHGLARGMAWVLDHPEQARLMGQRGRKRILAGHSIERIIDLHEALYARALGDREPVVAYA